MCGLLAIRVGDTFGLEAVKRYRLLSPDDQASEDKLVRPIHEAFWSHLAGESEPRSVTLVDGQRTAVAFIPSGKVLGSLVSRA
jgi:hypothetical protein